MNIAFVICMPVVTAGNGIVSQMRTWKRGLEKLGHSVSLISPWESYDWEKFDVVHFFSFCEYAAEFIKQVYSKNKKIAYSPILDPDYPVIAMKVISRWGWDKLKLTNRFYQVRKIFPLIKRVFARSNFEATYIEKGWNVSKEKIIKIPLSYNFYEDCGQSKRESFCFHASFLADDRKNVKRLVEAAKKYHFHLKLAGTLRNEEERKKVVSWCKNLKNVEYLGFLSQEQLLENYRRAKVFALPSTNEGVGIVALDAAAMGCDVVITNLGGPKEYYKSLALEVNPYDVDEIGAAVLKGLSCFTQQPKLQEHIRNNFSLENISKLLETQYQLLQL